MPLPVFRRVPSNPLISPDPRHSWESLCTFNPGAVELEGRIYILYRAMGSDRTSTIGLAISGDGLHVDERLEEPIYVPREEFEQKLGQGHSGCEDPRVVRVHDKLYMFYTAYDGLNPPRVAVTSISINDFIKGEWNWLPPRLVSPPRIDDKDACIIPEEVKGNYFFIHRAGGVNMVYDYVKSPDSIEPDRLKCNPLLKPRPHLWDEVKVGLASPPIKTSLGWLTFYHGVSRNYVYRVGAILLDLNDPCRVIARTKEALLEPSADYEKLGYVNNVVFPCGSVLRGETILLYYGAADTYVCVATANLNEVLSALSEVKEGC
ncbi:MAG: hypothetical protein QXK12_04290 [Candidatus Nezhaarchaeales archaeon]